MKALDLDWSSASKSEWANKRKEAIDIAANIGLRASLDPNTTGYSLPIECYGPDTMYEADEYFLQSIVSGESPYKAAWRAVQIATEIQLNESFRKLCYESAKSLGLGAKGPYRLGYSLPNKTNYPAQAMSLADTAFSNAIKESSPEVAAAAALAAANAYVPPRPPARRASARTVPVRTVPVAATGAKSAANISAEQAAYAAALARADAYAAGQAGAAPPSLFGGRKPRGISMKKRTRSNKSKGRK